MRKIRLDGTRTGRKLSQEVLGDDPRCWPGASKVTAGAWTRVQRSKDGNDLNFTEIDPIPMKNMGRRALERGEAGVKVGDDDLRVMTSKSGEKTFLSRDRILLVQSRGCEPRSELSMPGCYQYAALVNFYLSSILIAFATRQKQLFLDGYPWPGNCLQNWNLQTREVIIHKPKYFEWGPDCTHILLPKSLGKNCNTMNENPNVAFYFLPWLIPSRWERKLNVITCKKTIVIW